MAHSEQGFWATVFEFLIEGEAKAKVLLKAADVVGFRFLDCLLSARKHADFDTLEEHQTWLRGFVANIDREAGG